MAEDVAVQALLDRVVLMVVPEQLFLGILAPMVVEEVEVMLHFKDILAVVLVVLEVVDLVEAVKVLMDLVEAEAEVVLTHHQLLVDVADLADLC